MEYWLVKEGVVTPATGEEPFDGVESVMVWAADADDALALARAYDAGEISPDNMADGNVAVR